MDVMRIVASGPFPPITEQILSRFGPIQIAPKIDEATLIGLMHNTIALIVRGEPQITARVIEAGKHLRVIGRSGVGCDNVDLKAATARGIPVVYTPGASSRAVAEGALAMLLALAKQLPELDRKTKAGDWKARFSTSIGDLEGATLGIVGLGRIGREFARLVRPFDMRVLAYDPYVSQPLAAEAGAELVDLDFLLTQADFIVLLAPLTQETQGLIDRRRLDLVKPGAILVNLARGALLESLDMVYDALEGKKLAAVGLDVFPQEPPDVSHPIFTHPNMLCAPHAMGLSVSATHKIFTMMSEGMAAVLEGRAPDNVINPAAFQISSTGANR